MISEIGVLRQYCNIMRINNLVNHNYRTLSILSRQQYSKIYSVPTINPIVVNNKYQNTHRALRPYSQSYDKPRNSTSIKKYKTIVQIQKRHNSPKESNLSPSHIHSRSKHTPPPDEEIQRTPREEPGSGEEPPNSTWKFLAGAAALAGIVGGVYYIQSSSDNDKDLQAAEKTKWKPRAVKRFPEDVTSLPDKVKYLLIGGGTASFAAFRAIKSSDPKAKILVISEEDSYPYMRPPLSKEIWLNDSFPKQEDLSFIQWNGNRRSLFYESPAFYLEPSKLEEQENGGVAIALGHKVESVDARAHTVHVQGGKVIQYDKCLIATGVKAKNIPVFEQAPQSIREKTFVLRNIRDLELLWHRLEEAKDVLIVGGSFLGSELACALGRKLKDSGAKLTQVYEESGNMAHVLPDYLSQWTTDKVRQEGVNVVPNAQVLMVMPRDGKVEVSLSNGEHLQTDLIVVAAGGSEPNVDLAATSQLEVHPDHGGFLVNAELEARTDLYVAGDVACFYDGLLGRRRVEHHDHAVVSGRLAGENMTGAAKPYTHQSMFWSDLGPDVGYEAIGIIDSSLPTTAVFTKPSAKEHKGGVQGAVASVQAEEPSEQTVTVSSSENVQTQTEKETKFGKGVIFYTREKKIVGILLWNVFNRMHLARQILAQNAVYEDLNEVAKLFKLHGTEEE